MTDEILTLKEISKYLRLSPDTVYKMAQEDKIPALKIGKKWRFRKERIDKWLKEQEGRNKRGRQRRLLRKNIKGR